MKTKQVPLVHNLQVISVKFIADGEKVMMMQVCISKNKAVIRKTIMLVYDYILSLFQKAFGFS